LVLTIIELSQLFLRGRRPVRADPRLCTDEKHIRAQLRISEKKQTQTALAFIHNRAFCADALFIRTESTVGARSAQSL